MKTSATIVSERIQAAGQALEAEGGRADPVCFPVCESWRGDGFIRYSPYLACVDTVRCLEARALTGIAAFRQFLNLRKSDVRLTKFAGRRMRSSQPVHDTPAATR